MNVLAMINGLSVAITNNSFEWPAMLAVYFCGQIKINIYASLMILYALYLLNNCSYWSL